MDVKGEPRKSARTFRLSETDIRLLEALVKEMGQSQASVIALAIRDLARKRKVKG
jgi:hypothetical protein